jgi:hypothetical protein
MIIYPFLIFLCSFSLIGIMQSKPVEYDMREFAEGSPQPIHSALDQLKQFPPPRYRKGNKLIRLFNWIDPVFLGGIGQTGTKPQVAIKTSVLLQEELALHWNYNIVLPNTKLAGSPNSLIPQTATGSYIELANKYPDIPLGVITFWMQTIPSAAGFASKRPMILNQQLNERYYLHHPPGPKQRKVINFYFPDSLIDIDGHTQKFYLSNILKKLTRPINMINENGEEPPGAELLYQMRTDSLMKHLKDSLGIADWKEFMSEEKLKMRKRYISCFMGELPELKNTYFSCYTVEGGPIDRFNWPVMKKILSPMNGKYYSTPDFYPQTPANWKEWRGPWHGWKWIAEGRKKEIRNGDELFSPFICAGWSQGGMQDIRPSQWLGLLKCLSAAGAEFFYVGYFNLNPPYPSPRQYLWQAAMASYAQGITSRYEDELRSSSLLTDKDGIPILNVPSNNPNALIVIRKVRDAERYIICGTIQPFSNNKGEVPDKQTVEIELEGKKMKVELRRQGSVYVYDRTNGKEPVFYQLDSWHQTGHPDYWTKDLYFEAEVQDGSFHVPVRTERKDTSANDFSSFTSYVSLSGNTAAQYDFTIRDSTTIPHFLFVRCKAASNSDLTVKLNEKKVSLTLLRSQKSGDWEWKVFALPGGAVTIGDNEMVLSSAKSKFAVDQFILSVKENVSLPENK